jgi:hypothetical protein
MYRIAEQPIMDRIKNSIATVHRVIKSKRSEAFVWKRSSILGRFISRRARDTSRAVKREHSKKKEAR